MIQFNRLRNIINEIEYLKDSDYDRLNSEIDILEQELLYREDYSEYIRDNEIDDDYEDLYN